LTIPSKPVETEGTRRRLQPRGKGAAQFNPPEYSISRWRGDSGSVPSKGGTEQTPGGIGAGGLVNINTASQNQLESLPGVGPVRAGAIIRYRTDRRFATKADLMNVSGIGPKTFENIAPLVVVR
jgi:competence ComEA-like helix-hairpin-helix protein